MPYVPNKRAIAIGTATSAAKGTGKIALGATKLTGKGVGKGTAMAGGAALASFSRLKENKLGIITLAIFLDVLSFYFQSIWIKVILLIASFFVIGLLGLLGIARFFLPGAWALIPVYTIAAFIATAGTTQSETGERKGVPIFKIIFMIALIAGLGYVIANLLGFQRLAGLGLETEVAGEKAAKSGVAQFFGNLGQTFVDKIKGTYGWEPTKVEEDQPKGINIESFSPTSYYFEEGQLVSTQARVKIDALPKQDVQVKFFCNADGNDGKIKLSGAEGDTATISAGTTRNLGVFCEIERGLNAEAGQPTKRKVQLTAKYDNFVTRTTLKVYTLDDQEFIQLGTKDPFTKIVEPLKTSERTIRPQCVNGCGLTTLSATTSSQPLTQLGVYPLNINLQKDRDWKGDIDHVNSITIVKVPDNLALESCSPAITIAERKEGDSELINSLLRDKKDLKFSCQFKVVNPDRVIGENVGQFIIEADYDYIVKDTTTVDITPQRSTVPISTTNQTPITGSFILSDEWSGVLN